MSNTRLASLEAFLDSHPTIKYIPPSSPDYPSIREQWNIGRTDAPLAIVQPQSAADVSAVVKYAKSQNIDFTIRTGGHNIDGKAIMEGTLTIDMRAIASVNIAADRQSATIGGGTLMQDVATKLWHEGLATPIGTVPSIGYVGWAVYGGYGPFSARWGLGADQIIGTTIVNGDGKVIKADEKLLKGIRGAGGIFGVIVDVTVKTYSLKNILAGAIIFDTKDITKSLVDYNSGYQKLLDSGLPQELSVQQMVFNAPTRLYAISIVWSSDDFERGRYWVEELARLGIVLANTVSIHNISDWIAANGAAVPSNVYGSARTHNLRQITPQVAKIIGNYITQMPSNPATLFSIHQLRGISAAPRQNSVFGTREPHYMLEILGYATVADDKSKAEQWGAQFAKALEESDEGNILPTKYISLDGSDEAYSVSRLFGSNSQDVRALKKEYDPDHVFKLTVPSL